MSGNSGDGLGYSLTNARGLNSFSSSASPTTTGSLRDFERDFYSKSDQSSRGSETALSGGGSGHPFQLLQSLTRVLPRGLTRDSGAPGPRSSSPALGSDDGDDQTKSSSRQAKRHKDNTSFDFSCAGSNNEHMDVEKFAADFQPQPHRRKPVAKRESKKVCTKIAA